MHRLSTGLVGLALTIGACAPSDPNVRPPKRDNFAQARSEKNQAGGLDYLQFAVYRLAEIKQIVEAAVTPPASKLKAVDESLCGQLVVDRSSGLLRQQRYETTNCTIKKVADKGITLKADGVDIVETSSNLEGEIERVSMKSVLPYQIKGGISSSKENPKERGGSEAAMKERREFSLDLISVEGLVRTYRFSYGIELDWSQKIVGKNFTAFEDNSGGTLVMTGSLILNEQNVESIALSNLRMDVSAPRRIKERSKRTRGRTPDENTFHDVSLELKAGKGADDVRMPLSFDKSACDVPVGDLEVASYKGTHDNDKLSKTDEKTVSLSSVGILVKATDQVRSWPECVKAKSGELSNRAPYQELLFK